MDTPAESASLFKCTTKYFVDFLMLFILVITYFSDNDVDGDTVECGMTETMIGLLFQGSFKKQLKFMQFVSQMKKPDPVITLTLKSVPPDEYQLPASTSATPRQVHFADQFESCVFVNVNVNVQSWYGHVRLFSQTRPSVSGPKGAATGKELGSFCVHFEFILSGSLSSPARHC